MKLKNRDWSCVCPQPDHLRSQKDKKLMIKGIFVWYCLAFSILLTGCTAVTPKQDPTSSAFESETRTSLSKAKDVSGKTGHKLTDVIKIDDNGMYTCVLGTTPRKFLLHLPDNYNENTPILFMLHGYDGNPESFARDTGMNKAADVHGYAVVYPQGIPDPGDKISGAGWNSGLGNNTNDDVSFLVALAEYLQDTYHFGKDATYAAGFSNGAFMMYRLACNAPDTFKGVASVAGMMTNGAWDERKETADISILQINGTKDDVVPQGDGSDHPEQGLHVISEVMEYWKTANELDKVDVTKLSDKATQTRYYSDSRKAQVCYVEIEGGSHSWPKEAFAGFDTNELILDFFDSMR